jgi:hypothetical protein
MRHPEDFKKWALEPTRTNDELFTVELIIEWGRVVWGWKHQQPKMHDWDKEQAHRKERRLNPAYRPQLNREYLDATVEVWSEMTKLHYMSWEDRPIRDLSALRFFPHLEELHLNDAEIADLSPISALERLTSLHLHEPLSNGGHVILDLSALTGLPNLRKLSLSLRRPWPRLAAIAKLPSLKSFAYTGNLLALRDIPRLAGVERATLNADLYWKTPLRDLHDLPEMPAVRLLRVDSVADLHGIDRYPTILNADLVGPYLHLRDLEALESCTFLRLEGELFSDLEPISRLPQLREVLLVRERPLDLAPLAEGPALREVHVERCSILRTELSALNATMIPWDGDFRAPEPRPVAPVRFISYQPSHADVKAVTGLENMPEDPRKAYYGLDEAYARAESRWFGHQLQESLDTLLGKGWGSVSITSAESPGHQHLTFRRFRDVMRFREIADCLTQLVATCRFNWQFLLSVEPHSDLSDEDAVEADEEEEREDWLDQEFDPEREKEEWDDFRRQRQIERERMEREHRLQLLQQQGAPIDPAEFSPEPPAAELAGALESDEDELEDEDDLQDEDEDESLAEDLSFVVTLNDGILWATEHMRESAEYIMGESAEDWHALLQPVDQRPRPQ